MPRKLYSWKLRNREIRLGERTLIMGVLNVTPDSFSDGGLYLDPDRAFARALQLEEQGADIIDIGAESTKPGSTRISAAEEIRRLIPVLKRLKGELRIPISVDTYKAEVAELAIEHGAEIINDPSGFTWDPLLAKIVVQNDAGLILNHMRGTPETWGKLGPIPDVMLAITKDLDASISRARRSGVDRLSIVIDPGLGFGKRKEQNTEILARLADLAKLEYPILVGPSRKSFLTATAADKDKDKEAGDMAARFSTAAAITAAVLSGAHLVRVHDVAEMRAALSIADDIAKAINVAGEAVEQPAAPVRRSSPQAAATAPSKPPRPKLRLLREVEPVPPPPPPPEIDPEINEDEFVDETFTEEPAPPPPPPVDKPERGPIERAAAKPAPPPRKFAPRSGPPRDFRPQRSGGPGGDRPQRFGPPRSGPPRDERPQRSGPPRSGPPRDDRPPRSGPPRSGPPRDRDDRPARSGPPREWKPGGPPRSGPPGSRPPRPGGPSRFGGTRDDRPPRSGPPRSGPPRSGPPRSGPPRSGPPRGGPRSGPPRGGPPRGR